MNAKQLLSMGLGVGLSLSVMVLAACGGTEAAPACPSMGGTWKIATHCAAAYVGQTAPIAQDGCALTFSAPYDSFKGTVTAEGKFTMSGMSQGITVTCDGTATSTNLAMSCLPGPCGATLIKQ